MSNKKNKNNNKELDIQTRLITSGRLEGESSLAPVLFPSTVFENPSLEEAHRMSIDRNETRLYTRYGNPTIEAFELAMAELEGAEKSRAFASGMGAIASLILGVCETGDHIVTQFQLYAGTKTLFHFISERFGIGVTFVDGLKPNSFIKAVNPKTKLVFVETPANPMLGIVDLQELQEIRGAITVVDSTLAPPVIQTPLQYGVDISLHSGTKAIGGHNDATLGVISGAKELLYWLWLPSVLIGANAAPTEAFKGLNGIRTLGVRQERQCATALALAEMLESHPLVAFVSYPGLKSHPQYNLAQKQMKTGGSLVCFDIKDPENTSRAKRFFDHIKLIRLASSLGGPETLATHPVSTTHVDLSPQEMEAANISQNTIRVSLGLEHEADILADINQALEAVS